MRRLWCRLRAALRRVPNGDAHDRPIGSMAARITFADYPDVVRVLEEGMPSLEGLVSSPHRTWR